MTETLDKRNLVRPKSTSMFVNQIVETIWVDSPKGEIDICKIQKNEGLVKTITQKLHYSLKSFRLLVKPYSELDSIVITDGPSSQTISLGKSLDMKASDDINQIFFHEVDKFKSTKVESLRFFKKYFNIFTNWNRYEKLQKKIDNYLQDSSWIVVSPISLEIMKNLIGYTTKEDNSKLSLKRVGQYKGIDVYLNSLEERNVLYFGNFNSATILLNKTIEQDECAWNFPSDSSYTYRVDYLICEGGPLKRLDIL